MSNLIVMEERSAGTHFEGLKYVWGEVDALERKISVLVEQADAICLMRAVLQVLQMEGDEDAALELAALDEDKGADREDKEWDAMRIYEAWRLEISTPNMRTPVGVMARDALISHHSKVMGYLSCSLVNPLGLR